MNKLIFFASAFYLTVHATAPTKKAAAKPISKPHRATPRPVTPTVAEPVTVETVESNTYAPETLIEEVKKPQTITVFNCNTAIHVDTGRSIIVRAHYLKKNVENQDIITAKTLGVQGGTEPVEIPINTIVTLEVPHNTFELWAEEVTDDLWKQEDITHLYPQTTRISCLDATECDLFVFSVIQGVPTFKASSQLDANNLVFSNQTDTEQLITFTESKTVFGLSYSTKQLSFIIPSRALLTLPKPVNAASFTLGNNSISPLPVTKTMYSITPQKIGQLANPTITIIPIPKA